MALENIQTEAPEANESANMSAIAPNTLDLSGVDSPFSTLNGLNLTNIQNEDQLLNPTTTAPTVSTEEQGPGDPVKKKLTMADIRSLSNKQRALTQIESKNTGYLVSQSRSMYKALGDYEFDRYKSNVDRYRGYGKSTFRELGFNPMEDNETHYNDNTGTWREWYRMSGQFMSLANTAFFSNYNSISSLLGGNSVISGDEQGNRDFAEANRLGGSSKGGFTGFVNNLALNSAYSVGIAANVVAEEIAIWGLGTLGAAPTEGASLVGAAALQVEEGAKIASNLARLRKSLSAAFGGGEIANMFKSTGQMLKSLSKVDEAKNFYEGAKGFATAAANFVNPFRQTTEVIRGIARGTEEYRNLTNAAKMARGFGSFYRDSRENWFAVSEAQLEGGGTSQDLIDTYIDKYVKDPKNGGKLPTGKALQDIYTNAYAASRVDVLGNIPLIFLTNRVTFDGLFKFKGVKSLIELAEQTKPIFGQKFTLDVAGKGFTQTAKEGLYKTFIGNIKSPKKWVGGMLSYTKHNLSEGVQELGQEWLSDATKRYYKNIYANPNVAQSDLLKTSLYSEFSNLGSVIASKQSWQAAKAQIFSGQGISTFASGFLMGGLIGGSKGGLSAIGNKIWNSSAELYMKKNAPEKYAQYIKNKEEFRDKHIAILNKMLSDPETFFSRKKESLVNQTIGNNNIDAAEENDDDFLFYDHKDDKAFDHIFQSLDANTFSSLIDGFKELQKLNDDELADYFNNDNGAKSREKIGKYIERATEIKDRYDKVQEQYKNPFKPQKFEKGSEEQIKEFIAYRSFEDAKKTAIASQYGFDRALQRMNSILGDLSKDKPIGKSSQSDFSVLLDPKTMAVEIELLKDEAELLSKSEKPADKAIAKKKLKRSEALADYLEKYNEFVANKTKTVLNTKTGEFTIDPMDQWIGPLEKAYNNYLKSVADLNDDAVFTNNVSNSFKKIVDYYSLKDDSKRYMDVVNHLSNPNNLVRHADRINLILNDLYENRTKLAGEALDMHLNNMELNSMLYGVAMLGVVIDPQQLIQFAKTGKYPRTFYDIKNNKLIDKNDPRFDLIFEKLDTFKQLTAAATNRVTITAEELEAKRLEEEQAAQAKTAEEKRKKEEEEARRKASALPTEIKDKIQKAFDDFVAETGSDMTLEEFERDHPAAAAIKASAPATTITTTPVVVAPVVITPEPVVEEPLSDIEAKKAEIEKRMQDSLHIVTEEDLKKGEDVGLTEKNGIWEGAYYDDQNVLRESFTGTKEEVIAKIEAKYAAELATLEGKSATQPTSKGTFTPNAEQQKLIDDEVVKLNALIKQMSDKNDSVSVNNFENKLKNLKENPIEYFINNYKGLIEFHKTKIISPEGAKAAQEKLDYWNNVKASLGKTTATPTVNTEEQKKKLEEERDRKIEEDAPIQSFAKIELGFSTSDKGEYETLTKALEDDGRTGRGYLKNLEELALRTAQAKEEDVFPKGKENNPGAYIGKYMKENFPDIRAIFIDNEKAVSSTDPISVSRQFYLQSYRWAQMKLAGKTTRSLGEFLLDTQKEIRDEYQAKIDALEGKSTTPTTAVTTAGTVTTSTESKDLEAEKEKITPAEFKEVVRLAKFFLENPNEPGVVGDIRSKYPNLYKAIFEIEKRRQESLNSIEESYDKGMDLDTGRATITKADGTTQVVSDLKDIVTAGDPFKRLKDKINEAYDAERNILGGKAATPAPVVVPVATVPIQNGTIYVQADSTESYSKSYTFKVVNGEIVSGTVDTYFQGEYRDTKTSDPLPDPKSTFNEVSANERLKDKFKITEILTPEQEIAKILDAIGSLKELPSIKLNDESQKATAELLQLIRIRKATSDQVLEALKNKREEMLKNLSLSDFVKGDIVTFTNGEKGIVNSTNKTEQRIRIKVFGTKAGEIRVVLMKDVPSQIKSIDNPKEAMEQEVDKVAVTPDMQKKSEEGKQNMDSVMSNDAKMKEAFTNGMNTNSNDAENDFLNNIIC